MSLDIQEARTKLDILEQVAKNPELVFTELFEKGIADSNFLYQVTVAGKYVYDYLKEYMLTLPAFHDCILKNNSYYFTVEIPTLVCDRKVDFHVYRHNDELAQIDVCDKTFRLRDDAVRDYEYVMNHEYELKLKKLDHWWDRFQDLSLRNRVHQAFTALRSDKKLRTRIMDFFFWFYITKSKIEPALQREQLKIDRHNAYEQKSYKEDLAKQQYYRQHAGKQIDRIRKKQAAIQSFLLELGYTEEIREVE